MGELKISNIPVNQLVGALVTLTGYDNTPFKVMYGWYNKDDVEYCGWYYCRTEDKLCISFEDIPIADVTLISIPQVVELHKATQDDPSAFVSQLNSCNTFDRSVLDMYRSNGIDYDEYPPGPYYPAYISLFDKARYDSAFITVHSLADAEKLPDTCLCDGKLIYVLSLDKYYKYSSLTKDWQEIIIDSGAAYVGGDGIQIDESHTVAVKLLENSGLDANADGLGTKLKEGGGLQKDADGLSVNPDIVQLKLTPGNGITISDDGVISVDFPDGDTIQY